MYVERVNSSERVPRVIELGRVHAHVCVGGRGRVIA